MNKTNSVAIIISTYNWPSALYVCLLSIINQSIIPDEIIIADDGSTNETKCMIDNFKKEFNLKNIYHIWHIDLGFRLSEIRNKAISFSKSEYIIQIDGDIILHPNYIKDHLSLAKPNYFITGSRLLLNKKITLKILDSKKYNFMWLRWNGKNFLNTIRIPILSNFFKNKYKTSGKNYLYVKGCNMSFWKKDLEKVNGYNLDFVGWGKEDSEIALRLLNAGIKKQFIKFGGIQYHLYHPFASRDKEEYNNNLLNEAILKNEKNCKNGLKNLNNTY